LDNLGFLRFTPIALCLLDYIVCGKHNLGLSGVKKVDGVTVATAIADVFQNNGITMGRNLNKIWKIFEKIDEAKGRGVI
jgi:hypothetical protein